MRNSAKVVHVGHAGNETCQTSCNRLTKEGFAGRRNVTCCHLLAVYLTASDYFFLKL